jgi:hypothetical protein
MAYVIFGKSIQSNENQVSFHTDEKKLLKKISSPRFKHADLINDHVSQVTSFKKKSLVSTPYFVGAAILELSKLFLMRTYYEKFYKRYGLLKLKLCMTDTDSLLMAIKTEDVYQDLKEMGIMEFGNFPENHPHYVKEETGKIFYFKDESQGQAIESFVGLRAKCYSIHYPEETEMKDKVTAKGVSKREIKKMDLNDMAKIQETKSQSYATSNHIRSYRHNVFNIEQEKIALSGLDKKRWICRDNVNTLPFGHPEADHLVEAAWAAAQGKRKKEREEEEEME